ncbi:glycosyl hydrolase 115 family protein [Candidatus Latescibacterota bacterium]
MGIRLMPDDRAATRELSTPFFTCTAVFLLLIVIAVFTFSLAAYAVETESYISQETGPGRFALSSAGRSAQLVASPEDYPGVIRVMNYLSDDIGRVTNATPEVITGPVPEAENIVLIGTIGKSWLIDKLISEKKIDVSGIEGRWETFLIQVVDDPLAGVGQALVIAGSDKRGTIFGMFDISAQIGVSPWYWWADVPTKHQPELHVLLGRYSKGEPAVKYRGLFINDEMPALGGWADEKFGGFTSEFYEKFFELILRLKGNYFWPAMWVPRMFYTDDPLNPELADEMGIVMSTTHHEPMMRAHAEWKPFGGGEWNYETNEAQLRTFWTEGIERMGDWESYVTLGMRGDGDRGMARNANIALLEKIVADQREIIGEVTGRDVKETPQLWALYKEVQEYYDLGMRVPDDVTLLLCDDNWGNIRKLPKPGDAPRSGGYGIYYHFDYVGGPRNYKWVNTSQISRVWEQMNLAYRHGVDRIWLVNVGDIKPMEFPIEFFLDFAWNPDLWPAERLPEYTRKWAEEKFGAEHAADIAGIMTQYTRFNSRRKPELLAPDTYSLIHYREAETVVGEYNALAEKARRIYDTLPTEYRDAYYQLVMHPVEACANLNDLYVTAAKNRLYAEQGRAQANDLAEKARMLFEKDAEISHYYNKVMAGGKWNHMMDQTHIGYTYWQQPENNTIPEISEIEIPAAADMGVAIESSDTWWPMEQGDAVLPEFDPYGSQSYYIEIFNRGGTPFDFTARTGESWLNISAEKGTVENETRLWVSADWQNVPAGTHRVPITVTGPAGARVIVYADVNKSLDAVKGFVESNGYVSMEAVHYSRAVEESPVGWQIIPNLGRTLSSVTPVPVTADSRNPGGESPRLEYDVHLFHSGSVNVRVYVSPTLNYYNNQGLRYAVSIDDAEPQIVNIHTDSSQRAWQETVRNNVNVTVSAHTVNAPGAHVLKFWMVDPGVVLQKIVVETEEIGQTYLDSPESYYKD